MSVKNKILSLTASLLLLTMLTLPAGAVSLDVTDPDAMLPVDIILDQDNKEIRKVYDLSPNTDPSTLPMGQFERDGLLYDCTDVLREVIIGSETQVITQEEKVDSDKKDMDTILSLLPQEKEVTTEEGVYRHPHAGSGQHQDRSGRVWQQHPAGHSHQDLPQSCKPRPQPSAEKHH